MGGGAGRGKFKGKPTGRRQFSTPEEMASSSSSEPKWKLRRQELEAGSDEEEEDEEEEEEEGEGGEEKAKGVSGLIQVANPNAPSKASIKAKDAVDTGPTELSRREREELARQQAQERYMKLQEQGKTEQAKKDLERLALIRRQREEAAKKREEERVAKEAKKVDARK